MVDIERLIAEGYEERRRETLAVVDLTDTKNSHVTPIEARFGDNGVVQFIALGQAASNRCVYIQGTMLQQLVDKIKTTFGVSAL